MLFLTFPLLGVLFVCCKYLYIDLCLVFQQEGYRGAVRSPLLTSGSGGHCAPPPGFSWRLRRARCPSREAALLSRTAVGAVWGRATSRAAPLGAEAARGAPAACSARRLPPHWGDAGGVIPLTQGASPSSRTGPEGLSGGVELVRVFQVFWKHEVPQPAALRLSATLAPAWRRAQAGAC